MKELNIPSPEEIRVLLDIRARRLEAEWKGTVYADMLGLPRRQIVAPTGQEGMSALSLRAATVIPTKKRPPH